MIKAINKKNLEIPLDWFICPVTKKKLLQRKNILCSSFGCFKKNTKYGFWNFIPKNLKDLNKPIWKTWEKLQENGVASYINDPMHNLGEGMRKDYIEFSKFCNFHGIVLDIGVGPQKIPTHVKYCEKKNFFFIGIDPLEGIWPKNFIFVQGLGEYLPFKDKLFDQVLYVTSIDHFINPIDTLKEAKRVLKDDGTICIWMGEKSKNTPKPKKNPGWYKKIKVPKGAEDVFHFKRFSSENLEKCFYKISLKIKEKREITIDKWRKNLFYRITK